MSYQTPDDNNPAQNPTQRQPYVLHGHIEGGSSTSTPQPPAGKKPRKRSFGMILLAMVVSFVFGTSGGYVGLRLYMKQFGGPAVIYQNVDPAAFKTELETPDIVERTQHSVVEISTEQASTHMFMQQYIQSGGGSGVVLSANGYIITNNHVIEDASRITVTLKNGEKFDAKLIATDAISDIAVIKVEANDLIPVVLGDSSKLVVGEQAIVIGNPLGELGGTVTGGFISALDREISINGQYMRLLQTDAAVNPGNSGGGLFNSRGELVGIVNAKSGGSEIEGLGFAIPVNLVKSVTQELIEKGYVAGRPTFGISIADITSDRMARFHGVEGFGCYIIEFTGNSAAEQAGLKIRDRIIAADNMPIESTSDIFRFLLAKKAGDEVTVKVYRDGETIDIKVVLGERTT